MCMFMHLLQILMKFWTHLKTRNVRFSYNSIVKFPVVAVEANTTS